MLKNWTMRAAAPTLALVAAGLLSACGGGGGGAAAGPGPVTPASVLLPITSTNYVAVAQASVSSGLYLAESGNVLAGAQVSQEPPVLRNSIALVRRALAGFAGAGVLSGVEVRDVSRCMGGGQIITTLNDVNGNGQPDAGESVALDAQQCREGETITTGRASIAVLSVAGDISTSGTSQISAKVTLVGFTVSSGSDSSTGEGEFTLTVGVSQPLGTANTTVEITVTATSLGLSGREGGIAFSHVLKDAKLTARTVDIAGASRTSVSFNGTISSSAFGDKQVKVETPVPLESIGLEAYPSSGQMLVRGDAGSVLRLTVVNATQVRVELDAAGDGVYETTTLKTWAELS